MTESITISLSRREYQMLYAAASGAPPLLAVELLPLLPDPDVARGAIISPSAANCPSKITAAASVVKWIVIGFFLIFVYKLFKTS